MPHKENFIIGAKNNMTIKELKEALDEIPDNAEVVIEDDFL